MPHYFRLTLTWLFPVLYLSPWSCFANDAPWTVWKSNRQLSVSYRDANIAAEPHNTGLIEIKANITVNSTLSGFLLFLQDVDNTPNWLKGAQKSEIIESVSPSEQKFYVTFSKIWPLKPRLLLLHSRFWQNSDLSVDISVTQLPPPTGEVIYGKNEIDDFFLVTIHYAHWTLTPQAIMQLNGNSQLNIEYSVIANGAGSAPKWLANHMALKSIWKSMRALQHQLPLSPWQAQEISGIKELK